MITRYPVLEFLARRQGAYVSADRQHQLELVSCGYGFTLAARGETKRDCLSGVVGAAGPLLELYALVGFPNVIRFTWAHEFRELSRQAEVEIKLNSSELDASVVLSFQGELLCYGLVVGTQPKVFHELRRA